MQSWRLVDEWDGGFGWVVDERMERTSHALLVDGRTWLVDPVDVPGIRDRLGDVAGVIQLLDRHTRDSHAFGVPVQRAWEALDAPFDTVPVRRGRFWKEVALWHAPSQTLVCADALGTLDYFRAPGERIGWHPLIRPAPPKAFAALQPERILVGHGSGVFEGAADALADVAAHGRRRWPAAWLAAFRSVVRRA
ncbi:MAG TPA: hypothetical protein VI408_11225 [Gaiellaceae bacterium]